MLKKSFYKNHKYQLASFSLLIRNRPVLPPAPVIISRAEFENLRAKHSIDVHPSRRLCTLSRAELQDLGFWEKFATYRGRLRVNPGCPLSKIFRISWKDLYQHCHATEAQLRMLGAGDGVLNDLNLINLIESRSPIPPITPSQLLQPSVKVSPPAILQLPATRVKAFSYAPLIKQEPRGK
jgi:hypothetical protein